MVTSEIPALNAEVLSETQRLAEAYAAKFAGNVEGELRAWLHVAARREAMVSRVYGEADRGYRLPEPRVPAAEVAWEAGTLIWQHEEVHTRFIEVRLQDGVLRERALTADLMIWLGTMEGRFLSALTGDGARQVLARVAAWFGAMMAPDQVPGFVASLTSLSPREFFLLCAALETTARQCYARMETLANQLADQLARAGRPALQIENLSRELHLKVLDETFHEQAFGEMAGWLKNDRFDLGLTSRDCALRLARLLPRVIKAGHAFDDAPVITDGGLGKLFRAHDLVVVV